MARSISNATQNTTLATHVAMADNYFKRLCGLMGKPGLPEGHGLWIVPCNSVHSCFMRFPFDAVFVDKNLTVVHTIEAMAAWRLSPLIKGGRAVLELPAGTIQESRTIVGDQLAWDDTQA